MAVKKSKVKKGILKNAASKTKVKLPKTKTLTKDTDKEKKKKVKKIHPADFLFIVNPFAGAGKSQKKWPEIENKILKMFDHIEVIITTKRGEATEISRNGILRGIKCIVAVGGDGTISEVASGFFNEKGKLLKKPGPNSPVLGIIATGSGSDLIKTLKIPRKIDEVLKLLAEQKTGIIDMGLVKFKNFQGKNQTRPFINVADIGIGGEVIEILEKQGKGIFPAVSYYLATLKGLIRYKNKHVQITIDKKRNLSGEYNAVIVANAKFFGGGMMIAPNADPHDGFFDVVMIHGMNKREMLTSFSKIRSGKHIFHDKVDVVRARHIRVDSKERALLDLDGELPGECPVEFLMVPKAISVIQVV